MNYIIEQESKINKQGEQLKICISKKFYDELRKKKLLGKDLKIKISLSDELDVS